MEPKGTPGSRLEVTWWHMVVHGRGGLPRSDGDTESQRMRRSCQKGVNETDVYKGIKDAKVSSGKHKKVARCR